MSTKCVAFSKSKLGIEKPDNKKAFYAGWDAALREALAVSEQRTEEQAEQEPVGWYSHKGGFNECGEGQPLYAAPVRIKDLTDDELASACGWKLGDPMYEWVVDIGRWAIAADREKNK